MKLVYGIEGLDRLGKSTLIEGIKRALGFYQVIHFGKPEKLAYYQGETLDGKDAQEFSYQYDSFLNSMLLAGSGARLIFDRWHLGENVYAPMYRKYDGDYVFDLERKTELDENQHVRLILLTEDFRISKHFESDGESFDDTKRQEEQELFIQAFNKSTIPDKRIVCVTASNGQFRPKFEILEEAIK